jgi:lipopolysaccharide export system protein LptA
MRWLLLVAIAAILAAIAVTYRAKITVLQAEAPPKPAPLPPELNSASELYHFVERDTHNGNRMTAEIWAKDFRELKGAPQVDLKGVTIKLPSKKGDTYNLVKSAAASYFKNDHRLYSDGEVELTLHLPTEGEPKRAPIFVKTSGVTFDTSTGRAETDRPSSFTFEHGDGTATGAFYDPETHLLLMKSDAKLNYQPKGPHAKLMLIEGGSLEYHEAESEIWLKPWGRLTRENTVVEGENVIVHLQENSEHHKVIQKIDAVKAHGTDSYPKRKLQYSADAITVQYNGDGQVEKMIGDRNGRLVSTSDASETTVTARHVEMNFEPQEHESVLTAVNTAGDSDVVSKPLPVAGRQLPETYELKSDKLDMKMQDGGREIASVVTDGQGTLEFFPNLPVQHRRTLEAGSMNIVYGPQNHIDSFHAVNARTRTQPTELERKRNRTESVTTSKEIQARFDPKTSQMTSMEQSGDFTYDEGDRKARSAKATLDSDQNLIVLEKDARVWDPTSSTTADRIRMDSRTGDFVAEGNVVSSRLPDKDQKKNSQMLSGDQPLQARAAKLDSKNRNRTLHYEGGVTMWQGANRIQASVIDVDREKKTLVADQNVVTNLWEEPKDDPKADPPKKKGPAVLTTVHAPHLVYTEENRLADYSGGGVVMNRPNMQVKASEIRAFLADSSADSRLEKAYAEGAVEIVQESKTAMRTGTGGHAEYYVSEQKLILRQSAPKMIEKKPNGRTETFQGDELTYLAKDDSLLVNGSTARPAQSQVQRKK